MVELTKDELTQVYNFRSFLRRTRYLLDQNAKVEYVVIVWDVERFKIVNDMFDMETGDQVLKDVARLFHKDLTEYGVVGRIGNDKFACCIPRESISEKAIIKRLNYRIAQDKKEINLIIQAGIYYVEDPYLSVIKMCDRAMIALNRIKGNYHERIAIYQEASHETMREGFDYIFDMEEGVKQRQFQIVVQPIFDVKTGFIASGEVLVRWEHPKYGLLMPGKFIPVFEQNYLIAQLDYYVWEEACRLLKKMELQSNVVPLSVNISRMDFYLEDLVERLERLVNTYQVDRSMLRLEITESAYMDNPYQFMAVIQELIEKGYLIYMDDFGTGYSSLKLIKDIPFYVIKMDKSLVDEIGNSERAARLTDSIIKMSQMLGMKVIAEGIEANEQAACLHSMGCDYFQGYLYSKPVSETVFLNLVRKL